MVAVESDEDRFRSRSSRYFARHRACLTAVALTYATRDWLSVRQTAELAASSVVSLSLNSMEFGEPVAAVLVRSPLSTLQLSLESEFELRSRARSESR